MREHLAHSWHDGNDGAGSGLDADLLDGMNSDKFWNADNVNLTRHMGGVDMNTMQPSGFYEYINSPNSPVANAWTWTMNFRHSNTGGVGSQYGFQLGNTIASDDFYVRHVSGGGWGGWRWLWHSGNFTPATKANVDTPSFTGTCYFPGVVFNDGSIYKARVTGRIQSQGAEAAMHIACRDRAEEWTWYSPNNVLRLNESAVGDVATFGTNGVHTALSWTSSSDARLKDDVQPLKVRGTLQPVTFRWGCGLLRDRVDFGFIAQDVQAVYPEAVHADEDGLLNLDYGKLVAVLAAEVGDLRAEIAELRQLLLAR